MYTFQSKSIPLPSQAFYLTFYSLGNFEIFKPPNVSKNKSIEIHPKSQAFLGGLMNHYERYGDLHADVHSYFQFTLKILILGSTLEL